MKAVLDQLDEKVVFDDKIIDELTFHINQVLYDTANQQLSLFSQYLFVKALGFDLVIA